MVPLSVLEDDSHHTMHYSQSLPYADLLDHEAEQWLNDICVNLALSVKAKDFTRGALAWVKRLSSYMDMKHAVPRETRAHLAKLLYEMIIMPGMEPALVELWSNNCIRLIRYLFAILVMMIRSLNFFFIRSRHRKRLGPEDLELEWRPLYEIIEKTLFPKARQRALISES